MIIFAYVRKDNIGANVMQCPREAMPKDSIGANVIQCPREAIPPRKDGFPGQRRPQGYPRKLEESRADSQI